MDPASARRLTRLFIYRRLRIAAGIIAFFLLLTVPIAYLALTLRSFDVAEEEEVPGTVLSWTRGQSENGAGSYMIDVLLDNGDVVRVLQNVKGRSPWRDQRITLKKQTSQEGGVRYRWQR